MSVLIAFNGVNYSDAFHADKIVLSSGTSETYSAALKLDLIIKQQQHFIQKHTFILLFVITAT